MQPARGLPSAPNRRSLLTWLLGGSVAASFASFFYPVLKFLNAPAVSEAAVNEVAAGKVQDLKPNSGKIVKFGNKPALLIRVSETEWKAFSAVCSHLNCTVQYRSPDTRSGAPATTACMTSTGAW